MKYIIILICFAFHTPLFSQSFKAGKGVEIITVKNFSKSLNRKLDLKIENLGKVNVSEETNPENESITSSKKPFLSKKAVEYDFVAHKIYAKPTVIKAKPIKVNLGAFRTKHQISQAIKYLDITTNLPSNSIKAITESADGSIWFAYSGGLARMRANTLFIYNNAAGIPDFPISCIKSHKNKLFIGTFGGGLYVLENDQIKIYNTKNKFKTNLILDIECIEDVVYFATYGEGLLKFEGDQFFQFPLLNKKVKILPSIKAFNNKIYGTIPQKGYFVFDFDKLTIYDDQCGIEADEFENIEIDQKGGVYLSGVQNCLTYILNGNQFTYPKLQVSGIQFSTMFLAKSGTLWLGSRDRGLIGFQGTSIFRIQEKDGLTESSINVLFQDQFTNLWIGTRSRGLNLFTPSNFSNLSATGLFTKALGIDDKNQIIYQIGKGKLGIRSNEKTIVWSHQSFENITSIVFDSKSKTYWISTMTGLFSVQNFQVQKHTMSTRGNEISSFQSVTQTTDGLWISDYNYGVIHYEKNSAEIFPRWTEKENTLIYSVFEDSKQRKWICGDQNSLTLIENGLFKNLKLRINKCETKFTMAVEGENNEIYFATNNGLLRLKNNQFEFIPISFLESNQRIQSICYSKKTKRLWLGTSACLISLDEDGKTKKFNYLNGISSSSFDSKSVVIDKNDVIYWSTASGLLSYFPYNFSFEKIVRKINLDEISFQDAKSLKSLEKANLLSFSKLENGIPFGLSLDADINDLVFQFNISNWGKEENTGYYYKLDDGKWTYFGSSGFLELRNIKYGFHTLKVKAELSDKLKSQGLSYTFEINRPFFYEIWFMLIVISLVALGIYLILFKSKSFNFDNFEGASSQEFVITKTRILTIYTLFILTAVSFFHSEYSRFYSVDWVANSITAAILFCVLIYTYSQKPNLTFLNYALQYGYFIITALFFYRAYTNEFVELVAIETAICVLFSILIFPDIKRVFIYCVISIGLSIFLVYISDALSDRKTLFISAVIQGCLGVGLFYYLERKNLAKILFSEKLLLNSKQFVIVANKKAEIVFMNEFMANSLGISAQSALGLKWWNIRGYNTNQVEEIKNDLNSMILTKENKEYTNTFQNDETKQDFTIQWLDNAIDDDHVMGIGRDITIENKQRNELERLSLVATNITNGVVITNENDEIEWVNDSFLSKMDYTLEEIKGKVPRDLLSGEFTSLELLQKLENGWSAENFEMLLYSKNKIGIWYLINMTPILDDQGEINKRFYVLNDIHDSKSAQDIRDAYSLVLQELALSATIDSEGAADLFTSWCDKMARALEVDRMAVWQYQENYTKCVAISDIAQNFEFIGNIYYNDDYSEYMNWISQGKMIIAPYVQIHPALMQLQDSYYKSHNVKSTLDIPVVEDGKPSCLIVCESIQQHRNWTDNDIEFVRSFSLLVSQHFEMFKRKEVETKIKESESNFRMLNETIDDVFWLVNIETLGLDYISPSVEKVIGVSPKDYEKRGLWRTYVHPDDVEMIEQAHKLMHLEGWYEIEYRVFHQKTNELRWIREKSFGIKDGFGKLMKSSGVMSDITERKSKDELIIKQNADIISSINYAKRIQNNLLTDVEKIETLPLEIELFYKPKDIIGGDFYWFDRIDNQIMVVVADCTGHGVPGALMTSLGINALNSIVYDLNIHSPSKILKELDDYLDNVFGNSTDRIKDGMDIGIALIDLETSEITYAGAGRSLYFTLNGELNKIEGSRKSIGTQLQNETYKNQTTKIDQNSTCYLFSDGISDQFGGERKKRVGTKKITQLLHENSSKNLSEQLKDFTNFMDSWKKDVKQTDDMLCCFFKLENYE